MPSAKLDSWKAETSRAGLALDVVAGSAPFPPKRLLPDTLITLTPRLRRSEGRWFAAAPLKTLE